MDRAVTFDEGRLFGVLSELGQAGDQACLLILNAGLIYRVGPGRLSVELARLAEEVGLASFRFDISGFGDSEPRAVSLHSVESAIADARTAMDHLGRHFGQTRFVLVGLCSGATQAHHIAVADERVVAAVLLDGYVYATLRSRLIETSARLRSPLRTARVALRHAWRSLRRMSQPAAPAAGAALLFPWPSRSQVGAGLRLLRDRGVALLYVFTGEWFTYRYAGQMADAFRAVGCNHRFVEKRIDQAEHLYFDRASREELFGVIRRWLEERPWEDVAPTGSDRPGHRARPLNHGGRPTRAAEAAKLVSPALKTTRMTVPEQRHLFFGDSSEPLFGTYHPPSAKNARRRAVVLCSPFGEEAIRAHRLYRVLATHLARAGFHVLRFDFRGTGDSSGDETSGRLGLWLEDVGTASREALDTAGVTSVAWVGLRLGATLAALGATRSVGGLSQLVLWDPIVDGAAYLRDLAEMHREYLHGELSHDLGHLEPSAAAAGFPSEALGHAIPPELVAELAQVDLAATERLPAREVTVIVTAPTPESYRLKARFDAISQGHRWITTEISVPWNSDAAMNRVIVPMDIVQLIVSDLEAMR